MAGLAAGWVWPPFAGDRLTGTVEGFPRQSLVAAMVVGDGQEQVHFRNHPGVGIVR